jgi:hypothetical protein
VFEEGTDVSGLDNIARLPSLVIMVWFFSIIIAKLIIRITPPMFRYLSTP